MSYHAAEDPDVRLPWFQKKSVLIIAAAVLCLLAAGVGFLTYTGARNIPDISGELTIEADPDTRIYIGDKLVGTTKATLTWAELFGDETHEPLAMKLPNAAGAIPPNSSEGGMLSSDVAVPPESLGGRGAKALLSENLSGYQIPPFGKISGTREWIRRADGALDYIIVIEWTQNNRPAECFVLPVRVRKGAGASAIYFNESGSGMSASAGPPFWRVFGRSPMEIKISRRFTAGSPPRQFAEEIKTRGLWEPFSEQ
jgi:hypothetical protein